MMARPECRNLKKNLLHRVVSRVLLKQLHDDHRLTGQIVIEVRIPRFLD